MRLLIVPALLIVAVACSSGGDGEPEDPGGGPTPTVSFMVDVLPLFRAECWSCHGGAEGLFLESHAELMQGGNSGPAVIPGDPDNSLLVQKLLGTQTTGNIMPPTGKLLEAEIQLIIDWVLTGALE